MQDEKLQNAKAVAFRFDLCLAAHDEIGANP